MKVILISGKAQSGKDFAAKQLNSFLSLSGAKVLITHFADLLKYICEKYFDWGGEKDDAGRHMLQYVGTEVFREDDPNCWVDFVIKILKLFPDKWDYVIIPDCRFPNEVERFKEENIDVISVRIERPNMVSNDEGMSDENKKHSSETALDGFDFDECFINYGDIRFIKDLTKFAEEIMEVEVV